MKVFSVKLKNRKDNVVFNSILGGYSHLMWISEENPSDPVIRVFSTRGLAGEARDALERAAGEVEFDFVETR